MNTIIAVVIAIHLFHFRAILKNPLYALAPVAFISIYNYGELILGRHFLRDAGWGLLIYGSIFLLLAIALGTLFLFLKTLEKDHQNFGIRNLLLPIFVFGVGVVLDVRYFRQLNEIDSKSNDFVQGILSKTGKKWPRESDLIELDFRKQTDGSLKWVDEASQDAVIVKSLEPLQIEVTGMEHPFCYVRAHRYRETYSGRFFEMNSQCNWPVLTISVEVDDEVRKRMLEGNVVKNDLAVVQPSPKKILEIQSSSEFVKIFESDLPSKQSPERYEILGVANPCNIKTLKEICRKSSNRKDIVYCFTKVRNPVENLPWILRSNATEVKYKGEFGNMPFTFCGYLDKVKLP